MIEGLRWGLLVAVLAGCAPTPDGSDTPIDLSGEFADVEPDPSAIDFGEHLPGETDRATVQLNNYGLRDAWIDALRLDAPSSFGLSLPFELPVRLPSEGALTFDVEFVPRERGDLTGTVWAHVVDHDPAWVAVDLAARVRAPELLIDPDPIDFGEGGVRCAEQLDVNIANVGDADLRVDGLSLQGLPPDVHLVGVPLGSTVLAPDDRWSVTLRWDRTHTTELRGWLSVATNALSAVTQAPVDGVARWADQRTETFVTPQARPVHIVVAVDQSVSMNWQYDRVMPAIDVLVAALDDASLDWRLGIVTSRPSCFQQGILEPSQADWRQRLVWGVRQGSVLGTQSLLERVQEAVTLNGLGMCNEGFFHAGADLHVIIFSDTDDHSPGYTTNPDTYWLTLLEGTQAAMSHSSPFMVHGVIDLLHNPTCGPVAGGGPYGYIDAIGETGGVALNICEADWVEDMPRMARRVLERYLAFPLQGRGFDPASLLVTVDGEVWTTGWSFEADTHSIVFSEPPPSDVVVAVTYGDGACGG